MRNMGNVRELLAKNIKKFRNILGVSQIEFAEKVGCSPTLIGKIETMKRFPSADTIDRIADALKVTPADLFMDDSKSKAVKKRELQEKCKSRLKIKILKALDEEL